jgi:hypothetical protein
MEPEYRIPESAPQGAIRRVVHFSCGAASAIAAKLTLARYGRGGVVIVNAYIEDEHDDNHRFRAECERWFDHPITVLRDEKYGASVLEVWRRERYIKGPNGASCARALKRKPLTDFSLPGDIHVIGFTAEEQDRLDSLQTTGMQIEAPLIDGNLKKSDCLAMVERAGIELPTMYKLGFNNNNCIGCPKGGMGYWNKVRNIFPDRFYQIAAIQEEIGPGAYFLQDRETGGRLALRDLPSDAGKHKEPDISCSFFCDMAEQDIALNLTGAEVKR